MEPDAHKSHVGVVCVTLDGQSRSCIVCQMKVDIGCHRRAEHFSELLTRLDSLYADVFRQHDPASLHVCRPCSEHLEQIQQVEEVVSNAKAELEEEKRGLKKRVSVLVENMEGTDDFPAEEETAKSNVTSTAASPSPIKAEHSHKYTLSTGELIQVRVLEPKVEPVEEQDHKSSVDSAATNIHPDSIFQMGLDSEITPEAQKQAAAGDGHMMSSDNHHDLDSDMTSTQLDDATAAQQMELDTTEVETGETGETGETDIDCSSDGSRENGSGDSAAVEGSSATTRIPHACKVCAKILHRKCNVEAHKQKHIRENQPPCSVCGKVFKHLYQWKRHSPVCPLQCKVCKKLFKSAQAQTSHSAVHTTERKFPCNDCGRSFKYYIDHKRHFWKHTGVKPHECDVCGVKFTRLHFLSHHKQKPGVHDNLKGYPCDKCEKTFRWKSHLDKHRVLHDDRFECSLCGARFSKHLLLMRHRKEKHYSGKKCHQCTECGKLFSNRYELTRHSLRHTGERPFPCDLCGKAFIFANELAHHKRRHTGVKPFGCAVCGKRYTEKANLKKHHRVHTGEKPYQCDVCGQRFHIRGYLKDHLYTHGLEKPFECKECGKRFRERAVMMAHVTMHTGEKNFICEVCGKVFGGMSYLKQHRATHKASS